MLGATRVEALAQAADYQSLGPDSTLHIEIQSAVDGPTVVVWIQPLLVPQVQVKSFYTVHPQLQKLKA